MTVLKSWNSYLRPDFSDYIFIQNFMFSDAYSKIKTTKMLPFTKLRHITLFTTQLVPPTHPTVAEKKQRFSSQQRFHRRPWWTLCGSSFLAPPSCWWRLVPSVRCRAPAPENSVFRWSRGEVIGGASCGREMPQKMRTKQASEKAINSLWIMNSLIN